MTLATETDRQIEWSQADLEHLGACPACQRPERHVSFTDLTDRLFGVPGAWTLWRCEGCGAAYLDPRPSPDSIGRAYRSYYTHTASTRPQPGWLRRLREQIGVMLFNGYLNHRFGYALKPSSFIGRYRHAWHHDQIRDYIRSLPPPSRPGARLLEIGPGNGNFLRLAKRLGYLVEGLEPDQKAAEVCRQSGLAVREGALPQTALPENAFEHILLNHVFEHVHYPAAALEAIWGALAPGGRLWMAMPNLEAAGLLRWGRNWRGLEPPRHLVLFDRHSLKQLFSRFDFHMIEFLEPRNDRMYIYSASRKLELGELVGASPDQVIPGEVADKIKRDDEAQKVDPKLSETFAVVAYKLREV